MAEKNISFEFQDLLVYLAENMNDRDMINIKFRYGEILSKNEQEEKSNIRLLHTLKDKGIIDIDNIDELENIVKICTDKNERLLEKITEFKQSVASSSNTTSSTLERNENIPAPVNPFRDLLMQVAEAMSHEDVQYMKFFHSRDISNNRVGFIKYPIQLFHILLDKKIITNTDELKVLVDRYTNSNIRLRLMIDQFELKNNITQSSSLRPSTPIQDLRQKFTKKKN